MDRLLAKIKGSLMAGFNLITSFLQQATAQGTRSTILNPLGWMFSMCVAAVLGAVAFKAPMWITVIFSCFSGLTGRSEEHTSELQSHLNLVCRLLLEKKKTITHAAFV